MTTAAKPATNTIDAHVQGRLMEVDWSRRTARLHGHAGEIVQLRFGAALDDKMLRLATRHVEVRGHGQLDQDDNWATVQVQQISATRSWDEPFDLEAFRNNPNPKVFDPDEAVTIDLTDEEWESYNRALRESREA